MRNSVYPSFYIILSCGRPVVDEQGLMIASSDYVAMQKMNERIHGIITNWGAFRKRCPEIVAGGDKIQEARLTYDKFGVLHVFRVKITATAEDLWKVPELTRYDKITRRPDFSAPDWEEFRESHKGKNK